MIEDAKRLIEDCRKDPALRDEFLATGPKGFERLAELKGYQCGLKDLSSAWGTTEIPDDFLAHVIGGR